MKRLDWDVDDFLYCLEVPPIIKDDGLEFHYEVEKTGLKLYLVVIPHCNAVSLTLFHDRATTPLISFWLSVKDGVSYAKDKRGEHLVFRGCKIVQDEYSHDFSTPSQHNEDFDLTIELFMKPQIRLNFA
jgi:hypothetical protein